MCVCFAQWGGGGQHVLAVQHDAEQLSMLCAPSSPYNGLITDFNLSNSLISVTTCLASPFRTNKIIIGPKKHNNIYGQHMCSCV